MEINYLKEFVILARTGNYLEAADSLYMGQSSLSRHIKTLEEELDVRLLDRTTRKVSLTEAGRLFLPYAEHIMLLQEQYQDVLLDFKKNNHISLSIGSIPSMTQYHITDALFLYQQKYPDHSLDLIEGDTVQLIDNLQNDRLELAFIRSSANGHHGFEHIHFAEDTLAAVFPAAHPLARRKTLHLSELSGETLLLLTKDTFMYQLCINSCKSAGFEPHIGYTGLRSENMLDLVEKGLGTALLTQKPIQKLSNPNISIVEIIPQITTYIDLVYRKNKKLSAAAEQFVRLI